MADEPEVCFVCGAPDPEYDSTTGPDGLLKVVPVCGIACETQYLQMRGLHVLPRKQRKGGKKAKPATVAPEKVAEIDQTRELDEGDAVLLQAMLKLVRDTAVQAARVGNGSPALPPYLSEADALAHTGKVAAEQGWGRSEKVAAPAAAKAVKEELSEPAAAKRETRQSARASDYSPSKKRAAQSGALGRRGGGSGKSRRR